MKCPVRVPAGLSFSAARELLSLLHFLLSHGAVEAIAKNNFFKKFIASHISVAVKDLFVEFWLMPQVCKRIAVYRH